MENLCFEQIWSKSLELIQHFGFKLIIAILILFFGKLVAKHLKKLTIKVMERHKTDKAIVTFTSSMLYGGLWVFVIIAALSQVGIQTTSFIAVLGAVGLAVGLSLQGSLSNFAAGFLIILLRPFKVGDFINTNDIAGTVTNINIFTTIVNTTDNRKIIIPNSQITGSIITNVNNEDKRRCDHVFCVAYDSEIEKVKAIIQGVIAAHPSALKDPAPFVRMSALTNSSMEFTVRVWCNTPDYWGLYFDLLEQVKTAFVQNNIGMPFPNYVIKNEKEVKNEV